MEAAAVFAVGANDGVAAATAFAIRDFVGDLG